MSNIRKFARHNLTTANTIRYLVEWPRLRAMGEKMGPVDVMFDGGAGSGEFSRRFLDDGFCKRVIAFEPMAGNFKCLQENYAGYGDRVDLQQKGIIEIDLPDASVDAVTCNQVLEHLEEHDQVVAEFSRILKPGGYAIVSVPQPPAPWPEGDHVREGYTQDSLSALLEPEGFEAIAFDWFLTLPTCERFLRVRELPFNGRFVPVKMFSGELGMTVEERSDATPYGIVGLFRKQ